MTPIRTSACDVVFSLAGCDDLPAARGDGFISTYWKPDAEELALLAAGFPVKVSMMGAAPQPVAIEVDTL
ncbi:hypothetical protein [Phenylobacterium soli]|uniref:Uncharacterized protein n=1 Tax=Phenylobacterium soli TaxID=2170551 RepID=A0A328A932_9CAUL|nr:hypothetical protein [Phenylobacterium soli]RAK51183.1 hypothetical protein DJ017_19690 [Phenylobacterium soli]